MKYEYLKAERILAIDPMPQGFGYVVLEAEPFQLVDWGTSCCKRRNHGSCLGAIENLIGRNSPTALVIEDTSGASPARQLATSEFILKIEEIFAASVVPVRTYTSSQVRQTFARGGAITKQQIAEFLAMRFTELVPRLPRPRQIYDAEDARMNIFDALALAITHLSELGWSSGERKVWFESTVPQRRAKR